MTLILGINRGRKLASFDAGGVRTVSQLKVLEDIIHRLQYDLYPNDPDKVVLPCECLHMMGGNDTGGLLVVMFVKLRMSIKEATEAFYWICEEVYCQDNLKAAEKSGKLRSCIEELLVRKGHPIDLKLCGDQNVNDCAGFVIARPSSEISAKAVFRTYRTRSEPPSGITVVDAILATCSTQSFPPVSFGAHLRRQEYVGWGLGMSNPCRHLISEARSLYGGDSRVALIASFGTGHTIPITAPFDSNRTFFNLVTADCEQTAQELEVHLGHLGFYFRFQVDRLVQETLNIREDTIGSILTQAQAYLSRQERMIDRCVEAVKIGEGLSTLEQIRRSDGGRALYKGLPSLTSHFIMRKEPWNKMQNCLVQGDLLPQEQRIIVVSGMAGCGKSNLVIRFMMDYGSRYRYAFFIDASSRDSIQADIVNHVRTTGPAYADATFSDAMSFFSNPINNPWLLAYDGVDSNDDNLASLLPTCTFGCIIITTRSRSCGQIASKAEFHIELDVMSEEESIEVILRSARLDVSHQRKNSASKIAKELGYLPIALTQAGSYIFETRCSCDEYLFRLNKYKPELMGKPIGHRQRQSAYAAFDLCYEKLPHDAQTLLRLVGCVHNTNFPVAIIGHAATGHFESDPFKFIEDDPLRTNSIRLLNRAFRPTGIWDELILDRMIKALQDYSMASFSRVSDFLLLRMHPLLHDWCSSRIPEDEKHIFRAAASRLLACASTDRTLMLHLIPHIKALLSSASNYPVGLNEKAAFAKTLRKMKYHEPAEALWEDIRKDVILIHGIRSLHAATAAMELSSTLKIDLERKELLQRECIQTREGLLGPSDLETIRAKGDLAGTLQYQRDLDGAESLQLEVIGQLEEHLGPSDLEVVDAIGWLAWIYFRKGRYSDAQRLQESVLENRKVELGEDHLDTLISMSLLAKTLSAQGEHSKAQELQSHVIEERRKRLGNQHPNTLIEIQNLSNTFVAQNRYEEAIALLEETLDAWKSQLGTTHFHTLTTMSNLGHLYGLQNRYSEAEAVHSQALKLEREHLSIANKYTQRSMDNLAYIYTKQKRWVEATKLQEELLEIRREQFGESHYSTIDIKSKLAISYSKLPDHYDDAESLQKVVLIERKARLGPLHLETLNAMRLLGQIYHWQGRHRDAEVIREDTYQKYRKVLGKSHPTTLILMGDLSYSQRMQWKYIESESLEASLLVERRNRKDEDPFPVAKSLGNLAWLHLKLGSLEKAKEFSVEAEDLNKALYGTDHRFYASAIDLRRKIERAMLRAPSNRRW